MTMTFQLHPSSDDLLSTEGGWDRLLARSVSNVPFLSRAYLRAWYDTLGGGEWPGGECMMVVAMHADGRLAGIAPLLRLQIAGRPVLHFLGSYEITDYLDLIVGTEDVRAFSQGLLSFLNHQPRQTWEALDLYNLPEASPTRSALAAAAHDRGWAVQEQPLQSCPAIPLTGNWEDYLARLDKKQRHELRRKLRRAGEHPEGMGVRWVRASDDMKPAMVNFLRLMRLDPGKAGFLTPSMEAHFLHLASSLAPEVGLRMCFLQFGVKDAAGYLYFDYADKLWIYNSCLDPAYSAYSPGWILTGMLIQSALEAKKLEFDFLRGDEEYKVRLGGQISKVHRLTIERPVS